jgi:CheY-like chemotaxis protein
MSPVDDRSPLQDITVLVVDDDPDSCDLLSVSLEMYGANVVACESVKAALAVLAQAQPQAVISDIAMPQVDGYALIGAIRSLPAAQKRQIPSIALSAMVRPEDQSRALSSGFDRYLTKPLDFAKLVLVLIELLQERNENRAD